MGSRANEDVLNGIAYDVTTKDYYLTGKLWHNTFRTRLKNIKDKKK